MAMADGLRAFLKEWNQYKVVDLPGEASRGLYLLRGEFLDAVNREYPLLLKQLRDLAWLPSRAPSARTGWNGRPGVEAMEARAAEVRALLSRWNLDAPWVQEAAEHTMLSWDGCDADASGIPLQWTPPAHVMPDLEEAGAGPTFLPWSLTMVTEFQLRAEFEEYVSQRKREAFLAGYRQRPGKGGGRVRANDDLRLRMVALHLAGGLSYSTICEELEVELSWAAVQEAVSRTAGELGLVLPKGRGRKKAEAPSKYQ